MLSHRRGKLTAPRRALLARERGEKRLRGHKLRADAESDAESDAGDDARAALVSTVTLAAVEDAAGPLDASTAVGNAAHVGALELRRRDAEAEGRDFEQPHKKAQADIVAAAASVSDPRKRTRDAFEQQQLADEEAARVARRVGLRRAVKEDRDARGYVQEDRRGGVLVAKRPITPEKREAKQARAKVLAADPKASTRDPAKTCVSPGATELLDQRQDLWRGAGGAVGEVEHLGGGAYKVAGGIGWGGAPGRVFKDLKDLEDYKTSRPGGTRVMTKSDVKGVYQSDKGGWKFAPGRGEMKLFNGKMFINGKKLYQSLKPKNPYTFNFRAAANKCSADFTTWLEAGPTEPFVPPADVEA